MFWLGRMQLSLRGLQVRLVEHWVTSLQQGIVKVKRMHVQNDFIANYIIKLYINIYIYYNIKHTYMNI